MKNYQDFQKTKDQRKKRTMAEMFDAFVDEATESKDRKTYVNTLQRAMIAAICAIETEALLDVFCAPDSKGRDGDRNIVERFKTWVQSEQPSS